MAARSPASSRSRIPPQELLRRAARLRVVLLDVEGVLTDGRVWIGAGGVEQVAFDARDAHGLALLRGQVELGAISSRSLPAAGSWLDRCGVGLAVAGEGGKLSALARVAEGVPDHEVAYMGDDLDDLPLLDRVGLSACPSDARPEVRERVHFRAGAPGGRGAVRELCELIRKARGLG